MQYPQHSLPLLQLRWLVALYVVERLVRRHLYLPGVSVVVEIAHRLGHLEVVELVATT